MDRPIDDLLDAVKRGETRALARLITLVESGSREALPAVREFYSRAGRARVIGVTGPSGVGKSCLTDCLIAACRREGQSVAVLAVDPSSPYTGGAILGDRVRMQRHATDPRVFIRSMASGDRLGGLAAATCDAVTILDAAGWDIVLIETVGIGQVEVEVSSTAQTCVLVLAPNTGDDMQRMKSGVMEVADIFVVNKGDMTGADMVLDDLQRTLGTGNVKTWQRRIVKCSALRAEGIDELVAALSDHFKYLQEHELLKRILEKRVRRHVMSVVHSRVSTVLDDRVESGRILDEWVERVLNGEMDPLTAGQELAQRFVAGQL